LLKSKNRLKENQPTALSWLQGVRMPKLTATLAQPLLLILTFNLQSATWTNVSSGLPGTPVNVHSIAIVTKQSSTLYAHTVSAYGTSGLYKSTDAGATWSVLSSIVGVNTITVDPQNPSTLYVSASSGLVKSSDAGTTWTVASTGLPTAYVQALVIDPVTPANLYAISAAKFFKSTDGAATWTMLDTSLNLPEYTYFPSLAIDPANPAHIFAATTVNQNAGPPATAIARSLDGGTTWSLATPNLPGQAQQLGPLFVSSTTPSMLYTWAYIFPFNGPPSTSLMKSTDLGDSWTIIDTGLPGGANITSLILDPSGSSTIYLSVNFSTAQAGGILKSTNGGASWTTIKPQLPANSPIESLSIDPVNSSTFYATANGTLSKSIDGGITWTTSTSGLTSLEVNTLAASRTDPAVVYSGAGNNIFESIDGGLTWAKLFTFRLFVSTTNPPLIGSFFPDGSPTYPQSLLISPSNANDLYLSTTRGNGCYYADNLIFRSIDGGQTWNNDVSPNDTGCILGGLFANSAGLKAVDPTDPNVVYLAVADDGDGYWDLLKSADGGVTWKSLGNFFNNLQAGAWFLAIDPSTPTTLYAGVDDTPIYSDSGGITPGHGGVFKSLDGGATWNPSGLDGAAVTQLVIDPSAPGTLYAVTQGDYGSPRGFHGAYKSTDGGTTWNSVSTGLDRVISAGANVTALVIESGNPNTLYIGASGVGVFKTADGGVSWSPLSTGLTNLDVRSLSAAPGHTLYAGTSGGVFKIVDTQ
jgi:photosystem II stability/assembly factor-like uncharacterized protein